MKNINRKRWITDIKIEQIRTGSALLNLKFKESFKICEWSIIVTVSRYETIVFSIYLIKNKYIEFIIRCFELLQTD